MIIRFSSFTFEAECLGSGFLVLIYSVMQSGCCTAGTRLLNGGDEVYRQEEASLETVQASVRETELRRAISH